MTQAANLKIIQNAWVVEDIEVAAARWAKTFGVGPFFVAEYGPDILEDVTYRGEPGELRMKTAIAYAGPVQVELVEPLGATPNVYREAFPEGHEGFHHVCVWTDDIDAELARYASEGCAAANLGKVKGGGPRFGYVDARKSLGCYVELLEQSAPVQATFDMIAEACRHWDGTDPVRALGG